LVFAAKFNLGDTVEVYNTGASGLLVRDAPAGNIIGKKYDGNRGTVLAGPQSASLGGVIYTWWKVRWADALEGWSAEDWLTKVLPDLTIESSTDIWVSPTTFYPGDTVTVYVRIKNIGAGTAISSQGVQILALFDSSFFHQDAVEGLGSGYTYTFQWSYVWPSNTNTHTIQVTVDPNYYIAELSESNNVQSRSFAAIPPPTNQLFTLTNGYVSPASGDTSTTFNYYVTYSDPEGDLPTQKYVYIDGSPYTMAKISGDYVSGAVFRYSTTLSVGSHNYYFYFEDSVHGHTKSLPPSGTYPGPNFPPPDFSIASSPTSLTIQKGSSGTSTITTTSINGFNQPVQLTKSGVPSGVTATLNPTQVTPPAGGSTTSTLTVSVGTTATPGSYTLTVTGTSSTITHSVYISLEVTSGPPPPNQLPNPPSFIFQFRTDLTQIPVGETTVESSVVFYGVVSDPDGDRVRLQIELRNLGEYNGEFNEDAGQFKESELVPSGSEAYAFAQELIDHFYHWRARAVDEHGDKSEWVDFGDNSIYWTDFAVDMTPPETFILYGPEEGATLPENDVGFTCTGWDMITSYLYLKYSYRLEGYDAPGVWSDWKYADEWAWTYVDLPNGDYTIQVIAKDEVGHIDPTPAVRSFTVSITEPHIDRIERSSGAPGIEVTITGLNFEQVSYVYFGPERGDIIDKSSTWIIVEVPFPQWYPSIHGEETVDVVVRETYFDPDSNAKEFTYKEPYLDYMEPIVGNIGTEVTIVGTNFGLNDIYVSGHYVAFGCTALEANFPEDVPIWTDTQIVAKAPYDYGTGEKDRKLLKGLFWFVSLGEDWVPDEDMLDAILRLLQGCPLLDAEPAGGKLKVGVFVQTPVGMSNVATFTYDLSEIVFITKKSPGELRVYDSAGRVTGLVNGIVKEEIPNSLFDDDTVVIVSPSDFYRYEVVSTEEGTYGLEVILAEDGEATIFNATGIPTSPNATHQYTIDWDALSLGEEGVTVEVDSDGNGVPEYTFTSDSELTQNEFLIQTGQSALYAFSIVWGEETFIVSVESNSTVSNFAFSPGTKSLSFTVNGTSGTGFCNATIPKALLHAAPSDWIVLIDGVPLPPIAVTLTENATHSCLYFTYAHSTHTIQILGTWVIGPPTPPLSVSISPLSASILIGQSVTFTSTVSGGYTPYGYQWYLNGVPVSGATSNTWAFTPTTGGIYYIHLKVTDAKSNTTQSQTARITAATVPVGGYSIPIERPATAQPVLPYFALIATLTAIFTKLRPKTRRKR
jgi:hypothetical protein